MCNNKSNLPPKTGSDLPNVQANSSSSRYPKISQRSWRKRVGTTTSRTPPKIDKRFGKHTKPLTRAIRISHKKNTGKHTSAANKKIESVTTPVTKLQHFSDIWRLTKNLVLNAFETQLFSVFLIATQRHPYPQICIHTTRAFSKQEST